MAIATGHCLCGCGARTRIAPVNDRSKGWVKGEPLLYLRGHSLTANVKRGAANPNWKGGRGRSSHGYVVVRVNGTRQYEHILIAQSALGRPLRNYGRGNPKTEVVHHVDGDKTNNAPSNLLICTHEYHTALHHRLEQSAAWPEFSKINRRPSHA
ncbi:HNH endonuclease signature motif containing protein [Bordetella petrii]|uniref:HNH nuclease domain-containing protein n=1 Tax=Bordetella petrii (strain ATCC BAA-461 / DSM 12804 / CCUG 43448 / CIP 107267 / Se-1111R) TaxID=340100 RepID=A9I8T5_BORPD|nr:HNH endonuclease signature motif containing protein [Bordetella petrii]CAP41286.1 hypothetical protein predicted by Glimmer/Critica [Bordetella petrii]